MKATQKKDEFPISPIKIKAKEKIVEVINEQMINLSPYDLVFLSEVLLKITREMIENRIKEEKTKNDKS